MNLDDLRKRIDEINAEIIALLSKRLAITAQIAKVKKEQGLPVFDPAREAEQRTRLHELAKKQGLSPSVIEEMFNLFVDYSKTQMNVEMGHAEKNRLPRD